MGREAAKGDQAAQDRLSGTWTLDEREGSMFACTEAQHRRAFERSLATTRELVQGDLVAVRLSAGRGQVHQDLTGKAFLASLVREGTKANEWSVHVLDLPGQTTTPYRTMDVRADQDEVVVLRRAGTLPRLKPRAGN